MRSASMRERRQVVYPYSVLRGGVWSREELAVRLARDAVAAAHYRGFRTAAARMERLSGARRAYVSYRIDDTVYWTRAPVVIPAGEAVLTDGESMSRARCGNRLSSQQQLPVGKDVDLDTPEISTGQADAFAGRPLLVPDLFPPVVLPGGGDAAAGSAPLTGGRPGGWLPGHGTWLGGGIAGGLAPLPPPEAGAQWSGPLDGGPGPAALLFPSLPLMPVWGVTAGTLPPIAYTSSGLPPPAPPYFSPPAPPAIIVISGKPGPPPGSPAGIVPRGDAGPGPDPPGPQPPDGKRPPAPPPVPSPNPPPAEPQPPEVPEPATVFLVLGAGALGLAIRRTMR